MDYCIHYALGSMTNSVIFLRSESKAVDIKLSKMQGGKDDLSGGLR